MAVGDSVASDTMNQSSGMLLPLLFGSLFGSAAFAQNQSLPQNAQVIDQKSLAVLQTVEPPSVQNITTVFIPPNISSQEASSKPFHIYDEGFLDIIGSNVSLTLLANGTAAGTIDAFHEAFVWSPATNEVFFAQNAGAMAAGTGLNKSSVIQKVSLAQAEAVAQGLNNSVNVVIVNATPPVINPNGATNFQGQLAYCGEGMGNNVAPAIYLLNPQPPYNTTQLLNNVFGRQLNSPNDIAVNPQFPDTFYFTDALYGAWQDFRPWPTTTLPPQVYRFTPSTGALRVVAADFVTPNGITFSPDGTVAYVSDTGANAGFFGYNATWPATIYQYNVTSSGNFGPRSIFAYVSPGIPDGVHVDERGNVYAGTGDGVHVFSPQGVLLGKIWVGSTVANFRFVGQGRMVIGAETKLYFVQGLSVGGGEPVG